MQVNWVMECQPNENPGNVQAERVGTSWHRLKYFCYQETGSTHLQNFNDAAFLSTTIAVVKIGPSGGGQLKQSAHTQTPNLFSENPTEHAPKQSLLFSLFIIRSKESELLQRRSLGHGQNVNVTVELYRDRYGTVPGKRPLQTRTRSNAVMAWGSGGADVLVLARAKTSVGDKLSRFNIRRTSSPPSPSFLGNTTATSPASYLRCERRT